MRPWLTVDADVRCDHPGGIVSVVSSQDLVRVAGRLVVVGTDPQKRPISGCPNTSAATKACTQTVSITAGRSTFVRIQGLQVIRADLVGLTDGTPPGSVSYTVTDPGQTLAAEQP